MITLPSDAAMQDQDLITVDRFSTAAQARVACDYLRAHGVEALLMEQDRIRFDPLRPTQRPRIRVMVRGEDEATARELLEAVEADAAPSRVPRDYEAGDEVGDGAGNEGSE